MASDAGHALCGGDARGTTPPFAGIYYDRPGVRTFSLRSLGNFDVSTIASRYGGGGHKNAAGFTKPLGWEGDPDTVPRTRRWAVDRRYGQRRKWENWRGPRPGRRLSPFRRHMRIAPEPRAFRRRVSENRRSSRLDGGGGSLGRTGLQRRLPDFLGKYREIRSRVGIGRIAAWAEPALSLVRAGNSLRRGTGNLTLLIKERAKPVVDAA
jgi:hypothetical protein